jgi:predicted ATPase
LATAPDLFHSPLPCVAGGVQRIAAQCEKADLTIYQRDNFYVVTGCSGAGKSAIIEALKARGFLCADEAGREIVKEQVRIAGDGTPWQDRMKFRELLLSRYIHLYEQITERTRPVFFDRGIPELIAFSWLLNVPVPEHHRAAAKEYRYARKFFITPPWPEIFKTDEERRHSYEDALAEYRLTPEAYRESGYHPIEVPKAPVSERVEFILRQVRAP